MEREIERARKREREKERARARVCVREKEGLRARESERERQSALPSNASRIEAGTHYACLRVGERVAVKPTGNPNSNRRPDLSARRENRRSWGGGR